MKKLILPLLLLSSVVSAEIAPSKEQTITERCLFAEANLMQGFVISAKFENDTLYVMQRDGYNWQNKMNASDLKRFNNIMGFYFGKCNMTEQTAFVATIEYFIPR